MPVRGTPHQALPSQLNSTNGSPKYRVSFLVLGVYQHLALELSSLLMQATHTLDRVQRGHTNVLTCQKRRFIPASFPRFLVHSRSLCR